MAIYSKVAIEVEVEVADCKVPTAQLRARARTFFRFAAFFVLAFTAFPPRTKAS
jgi:hypothetical protein